MWIVKDEGSIKTTYSCLLILQAGAIITEDISQADIILGIKEVPETSLLKDKTYLFFSHTHKGNEKNMPMLQSVLDKVDFVQWSNLVEAVFLTPSWEICVEHSSHRL